jgi:hypothetical protein
MLKTISFGRKKSVRKKVRAKYFISRERQAKSLGNQTTEIIDEILEI